MPQIQADVTQNIDFVVFKNERGEAELAVSSARDAKKLTNESHKQ